MYRGKNAFSNEILLIITTLGAHCRSGLTAQQISRSPAHFAEVSHEFVFPPLFVIAASLVDRSFSLHLLVGAIILTFPAIDAEFFAKLALIGLAVRCPRRELICFRAHSMAALSTE